MTNTNTDTIQVAQKRKEIRAAFPGYKFSVRNDGGTGISVTLVSGPVAVDTDSYQINPATVERDFGGEILTVLQKVIEIACRGRYTVMEDSDYGRIPNFYTSFSIGSWDRPYVVTA